MGDTVVVGRKNTRDGSYYLYGFAGRRYDAGFSCEIFETIVIQSEDKGTFTW